MSCRTKLTVAVITMNRCDQLIEALESCLACKLPENTEFVILDNGSTDETAIRLAQFKADHPVVRICDYYSEENLGVGGGRAAAFEKAHGTYVYFMDDDAIIAPECRENFFTEPLDYMDSHENVASLTTQIYDEVFGYDRTEHIAETNHLDGKPLMYFYYGGSHFLRKSCFETPLYFSIRYSAEEYAPSIRAFDKGYVHVFDKSVRIIHKPKINKWVDGTEKMRQTQISCAAVVYATKKILYPWIFCPILWAGYTKRCSMYLKDYPGAKHEADAMVRRIIQQNRWKKVRFSTVIKLYRLFGLTVF